MPISLKPISDLATKFATRAAAAAPDYTKGVNTTQKDQAGLAAAAAPSWAAGVQLAITNNRFAKGVQAAGTDKWRRKASGVGAQRYPGGVSAAAPDWQTKFQKFYDLLSGLTLPPRGPKGDPGNLNRVASVDTALHQAKITG